MNRCGQARYFGGECPYNARPRSEPLHTELPLWRSESVAAIAVSEELSPKLEGTSELKTKDPIFHELGTLNNQNKDPDHHK